MGPTADGSFDTLVTRLQQDLENLRETEGLRPDVLAVTGDLAEMGKAQEFEDVFKFLDRLAGFLGLQRDRVLMVPGNHDINRNACLAYFANCEADDKQPLEPYWPKFRHYTQFFERFYEGFPGIRFTAEEPWTLFEIQELRLVVAGLNSAMKESHRDGDHYGWTGERQLRWFAEKLRTYKERGWMRIGLVHHNVQRGPLEDEENLRDADDLKRILGGELNLLLHGHTHEGCLHWLGQRLPVLSTGSASVIHAARPQEVPNQYQVIRLTPGGIWYGTRQYAPDQKRWIGDTRASSDGNRWFREEQVRFEHIAETFGQPSTTEGVRTDHLAAVVASYRHYVAATFQRQMLHDLCTQAEDQDIPGGLALLDIFIPQAVHASPPPKDLPRGMEQESDGMEEGAAPWEEGTPSRPVQQALLDPQQPWISLLGAPGAGKTSLTRWLCLKLCAPGESLPGLSAEFVPVRVEMRRFDERYRAATVNGRTYDFFDYLDQEHAEKALALRGESLRELWKSRRLVWIFDGMDEVPEVPDRQRYAEMIVGLQNAGPSRGLITSRIVGAQPVLPYFKSAGMGIYTLLDFDETRIQEFIERWHEKAFPGSPEAGAIRRERLERVIAESHPVRDLCKNPLLLTLIALLNRGGELPRRRHLLYRRAVELMAAQWEANKRLPLKVEILSEPEDRIEFLRELAWWMQFDLPGGRRNLVHEEDLLDFTSRFFEKRGRNPEQARRSADSLIGHLRERNYILARIGEQLFGFVHKTFLEYLVAEAIRSRFAGRALELGWIEELFRLVWSDDAWREILTLICGMLEEDRPANVLKVLQAILSGIDIDAVEPIKFGVFATYCLTEVRRLDEEPIRMFMIRLAELVQHELSQKRTEAFIDREFSSVIQVIGPRWPERERWSQWALRAKAGDANVRIWANRCALNTTPAEQHEPLLLQLLETESDDFVAAQTISDTQLSQEHIQALLDESRGLGEGMRCTIACGLTYKFGGFKVHFFSDDLIEVALQTLRGLLSLSSDPSIRIRAALNLAERELTASIQETVAGHLRAATKLDESVLDSIGVLGRLIGEVPGFKDELLALLPRFDEWRVHVAVADLLVRNGDVPEAIGLVLRWFERVPGQESQKMVVDQLVSWAKTFQQARGWLEHLRSAGTEEAHRGITTLVCERLSTPPRQYPSIFELSLDQLLERLETAENAEESKQWMSGLFHHEIPEPKKDRVREVLRKKAAKVASPRERLMAARAMRELSLTAEEEWLAILKDLAGSSTNEFVRLYAARMLKEEGQQAFESLAASATDDKVRDMAAFSLRALALRTALLKVGQ
jgi:predicted phosphodiesterase